MQTVHCINTVSLVKDDYQPTIKEKFRIHIGNVVHEFDSWEQMLWFSQSTIKSIQHQMQETQKSLPNHDDIEHQKDEAQEFLNCIDKWAGRV